MKKIFLSLLLLSLATTFSAEASDYIKWGNLNNGGIKSKIDYPKKFDSMTNSQAINPNSYGKQLTFSIYVKPSNVIGYAKLWTRFDGANGQIKLQHGFDTIKGTGNRKFYKITTIPVPRGAKRIYYGVFLEGAGKIELSNYGLN